MSKFYLKKLSIFGQDKTPSHVNFEKGLNIIHGVSDTGKTCIVKCIDFIFGGKNKFPIPENHGYEVVQLEIETENGSIALSRKIGKNKITLNSADKNFKSGEYTREEIGSILLPLIGINDNPQIIRNGRYEKQRLTWRTFMHSFIINEEEVIQTPPILISKETTAKTSSLSGLLYLISALNFEDITPSEDKKIKEARKRAIEKYISQEINNYENRKKELDENLQNFDKEYAEITIQRLAGELSIIEKSITSEISKQNNTLSIILKKQDQIAECDLRIGRYAELRSQYLGDIERLGFIIDGENNISQIPTLCKCPYCDNNITDLKQDSFIETANLELKRILSLIKGLSETESSLKEDKLNIQSELQLLFREKEKVDDYIKTALKPKQLNIQKTLNEYRTVIRLQNEIDLITHMKGTKTNELIELMTQNDDITPEYKPREHFPLGFEKTITDLYSQILKDCKYENFISSIFSIDSFDVKVNAKDKENFGKGYRAFLNVVMAITFRKYLNVNGKFMPRLLVVDSPLLSLEQGVDETAPESMKTALMEYLMTNQNDGQTIIVENKIPSLNYNEYDVNVLEFTKGKKAGRYGLLVDVVD